MNSEKMQEIPPWDDMTTEKTEAVKLFDGEEHKLLFLSDKPREARDKEWKKRLHIWPVEENKTKKSLLISSIKLGYKIKELAEERNNQLCGVMISIKRSGSGTNTSYDVKVIDTLEEAVA